MSLRFFNFIAIIWAFTSVLYSQTIISNTTLKLGYETYDKLHIPVLVLPKVTRPITIAIVDDGFRLSHKALQPYIYSNPNEIPGNGRDDDNNGFIDDVSGWDVSDHDNDVSVPFGRETDFYHGTMVAGIITTVLEKCFGPDCKQAFRILPVKVLSNQSKSTYLKDGYDGIAYAVKMNADIICCAWSGGEFDEKYRPVFDEAAKKGITIIGSAGNLFKNEVLPPASITSVMAVGAVDTFLRKTNYSNYGKKIDVVAFGEYVKAAYPEKDNAYAYCDGTSAAVAQVAGCAAVMKVMNPSAAPPDIFAALINTAHPVDRYNTTYGGKLGAGLPDLSNAINYLLKPESRDLYFDPYRSKGNILIDRSSQKSSWEINLFGGFYSINLDLSGNNQEHKGNKLNLYTHDSLFASYSMSLIPQKVYVPGNYARLEYIGTPAKQPVQISYQGDAIDSTRLYCRETVYTNAAAGEISDGSDSNDYANNSACKWQITVDTSKRIKLTFDQIDTQDNVDYVYVFTGNSTLQENMIAKFSGHKLPPAIVSPGNELLIWFVTDSVISGKGWHVTYSSVDDPPGYTFPNKQKQ